MTSRRWTIGFLVVALAGLVGWDVVVAVNETSGDTISEITLGWSRRVWTLPLAVGVVSGHLFWPRDRRLPGLVTLGALIGLAVASVVIDIIGHPTVTPAIPFALGVAAGHWVWGQRE